MEEASKGLAEKVEFMKKNPKLKMKEVYPTNFIPVVVKTALELKQKAK